MSKASQKLKSSKRGREIAAAKSLQKAEASLLQNKIAEASRPASFSLLVDNQNKPLTSAVQLSFFILGFSLIVFGLCYGGTTILDFSLSAADGYSFIEYLSGCEPTLACRVADFSELFIIITSLAAAIFILKIAFSNRYPRLNSLRALATTLGVTLTLIVLNVILDKIFW